MRYVFGPVPSWRLGQSLGVDPVPLKTCTWNCVYCQLGRTQPVSMRRAKYVPEHDLIEEVKVALTDADTESIDWVTFVGSGETLLHAKLGWMLREVKAITDLPIAVITNGFLLCQPYVRWELSVADAVLPSIDAGNETMYRRLNRPHHMADFHRHIDGLATFREEFDGQLWVEVMLVKGLNDGEHELEQIGSILKRIRPDQIHITEPSRSPVELWVEVSNTEAVTLASLLLGEVAPVRVVHSSGGSVELARGGSVVDAVVDVVTRHPLRRTELSRALAHRNPEEVSESLNVLEESDRLQVIVRGGTEYWVSAETVFPDGDGLRPAVAVR